MTKKLAATKYLYIFSVKSNHMLSILIKRLSL